MAFELFPVTQWLNGSGAPLAGGKINTYAAGTTTPLATYTDSTGGTPNSNPLVLDAAGRGQLWFAAAAYKLVITDASNVTQQTIDNIQMDNLAATIATLLMTGDLTMQQSAAATGGANQNSNQIKIQGNYWNGAASAVDQWSVQNVLGTGTNPSSTLTFTHSGSSGATALSLGGSVNVKVLEGIRFADQFPGADMGAKINAAIADLPSSGGIVDATAFQGAQAAASTITINKPCLVKLGGVTLTVAASPGINLSSNGASLIGIGVNATTIISSHATADIVQVNATYCYCRYFGIQGGIARSAGGGLTLNTNGGGEFSDLAIDATFNGIQIIQSAASGMFRRIQMGYISTAGTSWNAGILHGGFASGTASSSTFDQVNITSAIAGWSSAIAMCVLDSGTDTPLFSGCQFVQGGVDCVALIIRKVGAAQSPALCKFVNCAFESGAGTKDVIQISSADNLSMVGCSLSGGLNGVNISGGTGIHIDNFPMYTLQHCGVVISGGTDVRILNSRIANTSQASNGGFDAVSVSANVNDFSVSGCDFSDYGSPSNHPAHCITIAAGTSTHYRLMDNIFANFVTSAISDGGTGLEKVIDNAGAVLFAGTLAAPGTSYSRPDIGWFLPSSLNLQLGWAGNAGPMFNNLRVMLGSTGIYNFMSTADPNSGAADTGISRDSAGVLDFGNGAQGDISATLKYAQTVEQSANGGQWIHGQISELLTLSTIGTTTDTAANLLPANSIIEAVIARVTTTITTATDWKLGDGTIAGRFAAANATMTAGATSVGTVHADQTGTSGPRQASAAKVRVTTTGTPGAGIIRITVFYRQFVAQTS